MRKKIKALALGVGLSVLTISSIVVSGTPISSYGWRIGGIGSYYAWTGTQNGHWCSVIMKTYDPHTQTILDTIATAESDNGWAQTPTTFAGISMAVTTYHYTVDDYAHK